MKKLDILLLIPTVFLTFFGLFMIYDASSYVAFRDFGDKYNYVKDQSFWVLFGILSLSFFSFFDYKRLYNLALPILIVSILLLLMVFIPGLGMEINGARRWVNFGFFVLQPAEFLKLGFAVYLAAWFSNKERGRLPAFLLLIGFVVGLIMLQPHMGASMIVIAEAMAIYFLSGAPLKSFLMLIPVVGLGGVLLIILEPYRAARLATFLDPNQSIQGASYHVRQILIALGTGGLTGVGLGNSLQKFAYLPENTTDSIFAIIAEEIGFIGSVFIILLFLLIVWRGFYIAVHAKDLFGKLLAGGIATFIGMEIFINLASQTALLPLTGIPLPFISYGGSALIINLAAIGILINIGRKSQ